MGNNDLTHWGVPGMRWGVRRYQRKDGTLTSAGKKRYNKEMDKLKREERIIKNKQRTKAKFDKLETKRNEINALKSATSDRKSSKKTDSKRPMSDSELREKVNRMELEKRYRDLMKEANPPKSTAGKDFVTSVIKKTGDEIAPQVAKHYAAKLANELIGEVAVYANNKKKS